MSCDKPTVINIESKSERNTKYRQVLYTGDFQVVLMCLRPGEEIGYEVHNDKDQFIRIEAGSGTAVIGKKKYSIQDGSAVIVPAGYGHNIINDSTEDMKIYTIYSRPEHPYNRVQIRKPL